MICPHCEKDTPATLPYCQSCGLSVNLSFDRVQRSFENEAADLFERETEARCRSYLIAGAAALIAVLAGRALLLSPPPAVPVLPAYVVPEGSDAATAVVPALPLEVPPLAIPR